MLRFQPYSRVQLIKIRHNMIIQCHVNYMEMKKFNYMLIVIDILRKSSQNDFRVS